MFQTSSNNNTRIAKNTILLFPVCYLPWLCLCVQVVLEKCLSLPSLAILTHQKSLYVYIHLLLRVSMMNKVMRRKWFTFKLTSKMYETFSISHEQSKLA